MVAKEPKFDLRELRKYCQQLFDVQPEVFDGAFAVESDEKHTKGEVKKKIDSFLKREVK